MRNWEEICDDLLEELTSDNNRKNPYITQLHHYKTSSKTSKVSIYIP